jgi:uncharacterized protein with PIN domain
VELPGRGGMPRNQDRRAAECNAELEDISADLCRSISRRALVRRFSFTGVRWVRRSRSTARTSEGRSAHRPLRIKRRKVESICHLCEKVRYSTEAQMVTSNSTLARRKRHAIRAFGVGRHSLADGTRWCHRYDIAGARPPAARGRFREQDVSATRVRIGRAEAAAQDGVMLA